MTRADVYELENELIFLLNMAGWKIRWSKEKYCRYDAIGTDLKGQSCVLEFKFRRKFYPTKILETKKYYALDQQPQRKKYYCVVDQKGCHIYDLANIDRLNLIALQLPKETITENIEKEKRLVYEIKHAPDYFHKFQFF